MVPIHFLQQLTRFINQSLFAKPFDHYIISPNMGLQSFRRQTIKEFSCSYKFPGITQTVNQDVVNHNIVVQLFVFHLMKYFYCLNNLSILAQAIQQDSIGLGIWKLATCLNLMKQLQSSLVSLHSTKPTYKSVVSHNIGSYSLVGHFMKEINCLINSFLFTKSINQCVIANNIR